MKQAGPSTDSLGENMSELRALLASGGGPSTGDVPIAVSPGMQNVMAEALRFAHSSATILLTGESGTGKEVIARMIHSQSPRRSRPYIRVNCAALPETLIESELFGHEQGAFTGALQSRKGRLESAEDGTILLDEISEIPLSIQAKLLRVLKRKNSSHWDPTERERSRRGSSPHPTGA